MPVGPYLRAIDLGDDLLRASDKASLVPEVPAEAAVAVGVGGRSDDHEHVHGRHVAEVGRIALELGGEDHGDVVDDAAVEGRAAHLPEDLLDGHGERVVPARVEPTRVFDGSVAGYQDVLKLVAARGKGVDEGVGVGVDGDVDPVAGVDESDGLLGGDEVAVVVVLPGHGSLMGCYSSGPIVRIVV